MANNKDNKKFSELSLKVTQLKEQIAKLEKLTNKDIELLNSNLMTLPNSPQKMYQ